MSWTDYDMLPDDDRPEPRVAEAFHPSEYIAEELEARGWTLDDLAAQTVHESGPLVARLGWDLYFLCDPDMRMGWAGARDLAAAFGTGEAVWLNLEKAWLAAGAPREGRTEP